MSAAAKVGAFMLVVLAILGFFILKIEDIKIDRKATMRTIDVEFDSVAGLDEKSAVRVAGVRVGKVRQIRLEQGRAIVTLEIDSDVRLAEGATAFVANLGLLGEKYIELVPGSVTSPELGDLAGKRLQGTMVASMDDVTNQISKIAEDVKAVTASLRNAMGGPTGEQRMEEIVENLRQITDRIRSILDTNQDNVNVSAENIRKITEDLRREIPRIADSIDRFASSVSGTVTENREDVRVVVENLKVLSDDLKVTVDNLNSITGQIKSGEGTVGKLIYDDAAHESLTSALQSVDDGVKDLSDTLGRVRRMQLGVEVKGDYYSGIEETSAGFGDSSRSGVALMLSPNPETNRFLQLEVNNDPAGKRKQKIVTETVTGPDGVPVTTTTETVTYNRDFVFSAQAGWRIGDSRIRVGIFDGTGGVGADYFVNPRIALTGEAYDFGRSDDVDPRLRFFGRYTIWEQSRNLPTIFVAAGVDNVLNDTAYTFGGGVRWSDDDLKYLLGSVPIP
jgi:phospholipid/cholesterol/gamma-HCH transport system substrate-binding protein